MATGDTDTGRLVRTAANPSSCISGIGFAVVPGQDPTQAMSEEVDFTDPHVARLLAVPSYRRATDEERTRGAEIDKAIEAARLDEMRTGKGTDGTAAREVADLRRSLEEHQGTNQKLNRRLAELEAALANTQSGDQVVKLQRDLEGARAELRRLGEENEVLRRQQKAAQAAGDVAGLTAERDALQAKVVELEALLGKTKPEGDDKPKGKGK